MERSWLALRACPELIHSKESAYKKFLYSSRIFTCESMLHADKSKLEFVEIIYLFFIKCLDICGLLRIEYFLVMEQEAP